MGQLGLVLSFVRVTRNGAEVSDVKVNLGGGLIVTAEHSATPGVDSNPLPGDYAYVAPAPQSGREVTAGYVDPETPPKALAGETRAYARGDDGNAVAEVWVRNTGEVTIANDNGSVTLRANGSILGQNSSGSFELQVAGDFVVNGVIIAADGSVTIPSSLTLNGKEIAEHDHTINSGSSAPGPTGPNN